MANIPSVFFLFMVLVASNFVYSSPVPQFGFAGAVGNISREIGGLLGGSGASGGSTPGGGAPGGGAPGGGGLGGATGGIGGITG